MHIFIVTAFTTAVLLSLQASEGYFLFPFWRRPPFWHGRRHRWRTTTEKYTTSNSFSTTPAIPTDNPTTLRSTDVTEIPQFTDANLLISTKYLHTTESTPLNSPNMSVVSESVQNMLRLETSTLATTETSGIKSDYIQKNNLAVNYSTDDPLNTAEQLNNNTTLKTVPFDTTAESSTTQLLITDELLTTKDSPITSFLVNFNEPPITNYQTNQTELPINSPLQNYSEVPHIWYLQNITVLSTASYLSDTTEVPIDNNLSNTTEVLISNNLSNTTELPIANNLSNAAELPNDNYRANTRELSIDSYLSNTTELPVNYSSNITEILTADYLSNNTELSTDTFLSDTTELPATNYLLYATGLSPTSYLPKTTELTNSIRPQTNESENLFLMNYIDANNSMESDFGLSDVPTTDTNFYNFDNLESKEIIPNNTANVSETEKCPPSGCYQQLPCTGSNCSTVLQMPILIALLKSILLNTQKFNCNDFNCSTVEINSEMESSPNRNYPTDIVLLGENKHTGKNPKNLYSDLKEEENPYNLDYKGPFSYRKFEAPPLDWFSNIYIHGSIQISGNSARMKIGENKEKYELL